MVLNRLFKWMGTYIKTLGQAFHCSNAVPGNQPFTKLKLFSDAALKTMLSPGKIKAL
jgi:hypothetical protein